MSSTALLGLLGMLGAPLAPPDRSAGSLDLPPVPWWERTLPGRPVPAARHEERGSPVIAGRDVLLGARSVPALLRLDRVSGEELDRYPAHAPVQSAPAVRDGSAWYCDMAGYTYRRPLAGRGPRWEHFGGAPILADPVLDGDLLLVSSVDGLLYALDADTGDMEWRYQHPPDPTRQRDITLFGSPSPVVVGDLVVAGFSDGSVVALERGSGSVVWQVGIGEGGWPDIVATPVARDGVLYGAGFSGPLVALDLATRQVRWRVDAGGGSSPAVEGDVLYHGGSDGVLRAIDRRSGQLDWSWDSQTGGALGTPLPVAAGILVASSDATLYLVDRENGHLEWTLDTGQAIGGISARPAVAGRELLVVTNAGRLRALLAPSDP